MRLPQLETSRQEALARIRVVLVGTRQPRNIGASARAMKCMGLRQLALVAPEHYPHPQAEALAVSAVDVLSAASCHATLAEAVVGARQVYGLSARLRRDALPLLDVRQAAQHMLEQASAGPICVVFGNEESGLDRAALQLCQQQVYIASDPECPSLNLAAAVQVLCHELYAAALQLHPERHVRQGAGAEALDRFCAQADPLLQSSGYYQNKSAARARLQLRQLLERARPDQGELHQLLGLLRQLRSEPGRATERLKPD